jgi:hypothetical protein
LGSALPMPPTAEIKIEGRPDANHLTRIDKRFSVTGLSSTLAGARTAERCVDLPLRFQQLPLASAMDAAFRLRARGGKGKKTRSLAGYMLSRS